MKKMMFVATLMVGMFGAMAQNQEAKKAENKQAATSKKEEYQCPMKCEGKKTYDKKGKCPACTMDLKLVKK
jgi:uncharacterized paraquat-inducible protein A